MSSTKVCPNCQCTTMVSLISINKKICPDCKRITDWKLDPDQKPLLRKPDPEVD